MMPEFHQNKEIKWEMYVDESKHGSSRYDMIMGRDLMTELGFKIDFKTGHMEWDNAIVPMHDVNNFNEKT